MDLPTMLSAYEADELNDESTIKLFQYLIDKGLVWHLQGSYGRAAAELIEEGLCTLPPVGVAPPN